MIFNCCSYQCINGKTFWLDFATGLPILINRKGDSYNFILVIVNWFTKMVNYKPVKITINALRLAEVIINLVMHYLNLSDLIFTNQSSLFTLKFSFSLCYFFNPKCWLFADFYPQSDSQTKKQKSTIEAYLQAFLNFGQNNWAKFPGIAKFAYNNAKNASTGHTPFELNCGYHPYVSFKENTNPCSQSKMANELSTKLQ